MRLFQLTLAVRSEGAYGPLGEPELPPTAALGGALEAAASARLRQAPADLERRILTLQIHILPLERQKLTLPQASSDGQYVEGPHTVALNRVEEHPYLIPGERLYLLSAGLWRLHGRGGVAWNQAVAGSLFERLAERAVDV
jgi:hypothetical protein